GLLDDEGAERERGAVAPTFEREPCDREPEDGDEPDHGGAEASAARGRRERQGRRGEHDGRGEGVPGAQAQPLEAAYLEGERARERIRRRRRRRGRGALRHAATVAQPRAA